MRVDSTGSTHFLFPMATSGVIREIKKTPTGEREEFVCRLLDRSATHVVVLYKAKESRRVGDLRLPKGILTYGYFWLGRPYNVYHWVRSNGQTLGFYVNLADEVRIRPGAVEWRDLAVDLFFSPDGTRVQILDEDQLASLPADLRSRANAARAHVLTHRDELLAEVASMTAHLRGGGRRGPRQEDSRVRSRTP